MGVVGDGVWVRMMEGGVRGSGEEGAFGGEGDVPESDV